MKFFSLSSLVLAAAGLASAYTYQRLDKSNTAFIIVDHQTGLFSVARDFDPVLFRNAVLANAELAKIFNLPVVITSSNSAGPNGPLLSEYNQILPKATIVKRPGEVNAWDNADFRQAVQATGKKQVVIAGITTDGTTFAALSMVEAGYQVFVNLEASGTTTELIRDAANQRMRDAGVQVVSMFQIMSELMRDWRSTPGATELLPFLDTYYPAYGVVARSWTAASGNHTS